MGSESGGGNGALYFIVGGLVVVVGVMAYFLLGEPGGSKNSAPNIKIEVPAPAKKQ